MHFLKKGSLITILLFFIAFSNNTVCGQEHFYFGAGIDQELPIDKFKNFYTYGIGLTGDANYKITPKLSAYFCLSYLKYYINRKNLGISGTEAFLPIIFGGKYYISSNLYLLGAGGISLDFGYVITPYNVYKVGVGKLLFNKINAELTYSRSGSFDFSPRELALRTVYTFKKF